ncbi:MAG: hypothetical protein AAGF11_21355 [Myxococcota bacterium]
MNSLPADLSSLVTTSGGARKLLLILIVPCLLIGTLMVATGTWIGGAVTLLVGLGLVALMRRRRDPATHPVVRLLLDRPQSIAGFHIDTMMALGARSAHVRLYDAGQRPLGVLLVENVANLPHVLATMHRYAPHAQVVQTQTRVRV